MSGFHKLSHAIWHCQYHLVWVPKYRYRILKGSVGQEVSTCIQVFAQQKECEVVELNVQVDHVHLLVLVPPKVSYFRIDGYVEGSQCNSCLQAVSLSFLRSLIGGIIFGARGYCVDTVGLYAEMIRKYVKYQEAKDRRSEQLDLKY